MAFHLNPRADDGREGFEDVAKTRSGILPVWGAAGLIFFPRFGMFSSEDWKAEPDHRDRPQGEIDSFRESRYSTQRRRDAEHTVLVSNPWPLVHLCLRIYF